MNDMIIVGAGTAGLSAAIYAQRAGKKVLLLEASVYGGQIVNTPDIENYPGIAHISGFEFATNLYQQAMDLGAQIKYEKVISIREENGIKYVQTNKEEYPTQAIIIATGLVRRNLNLENEDRLSGKGISYCATCDGAFFRNKVVAVNGGGNTALEDAQFLADLCEKVYLIHRRDEFRADQAEIDRVNEKKNIEFVLNSTVSQLNGQDCLESIVVKDKEGKERTLEVAALFVAIGQIPVNEVFKDFVDLDEAGYIISDEMGITKHPGIFAAGDCRSKSLRQLATAAGDGANAATAAYHYLKNL